MQQSPEPRITGRQNNKSVSLFLYRLVPILCTVSLICYLLFSQGLRYLLGGWDYHVALFKGIFPQGLLVGLPQHIPLIPYFPSWYNGLLFFGFLSSCVASAWLTHSLIRGRRSELGPHLILFSLTVAIVPTLLMATFFWPDGRGKLTLEMSFWAALFITVILAGLKLIIFSHKIPVQMEPEHKNRETLGWAWIFLPFVVLIFLLVYIRGSISIIGSDAMAYHLPLAASWFRYGSITRGFDIQFWYPSNAELIVRWGFLFSSENFIFLVSLSTSIFCIYMIYKLGRVIGQAQQAALVAACCAVTVPLIPFLATATNSDVMGVLFLSLSVFFLIRWIQSDLDKSSHLLCAGLAAGLAAGTKLNMLTGAFTIALVVMVALLRSEHFWRITGLQIEDMKTNWAWLFKSVGLFFSAALLGGFYWYLRNLVEYRNPFYPVSMLGLPGWDIETIQPLIYIEYIGSIWKRLLYPWIEVSNYSLLDDGTGAVIATTAIPALLLWPFLRNRTKDITPRGSGVIYAIMLISLVLFAWSGIMYMRLGFFMILISFLLVGELWMAVPSIVFRLVTFTSFLIMTVTIAQSLAGGYLYSSWQNSVATRAERLYVPDIVDFLPPARIFNATEAHRTYGLMGRDYRHEVVTLFTEARPEDVLKYQPTYILLNKNREEIFRRKMHLERVGAEMKGAGQASLWKVVVETQNAP